MTIVSCDAPAESLLQAYSNEHYTDCYTTTVQHAVDLSAYITAFYNSAGFRPERVLLGLVLGRHSDNLTVGELAADRIQTFSAWTVESRRPDEILLADMSGATRSWLKVERISEQSTKLYFGSAVVNEQGNPGSRPPLFHLLMPFHRVYSRVLLAAAVSRLTG